MVLQAQVHPSEEWAEVVAFDWWAPPSADTMSRYLAYRNEPTAEQQNDATTEGASSGGATAG